MIDYRLVLALLEGSEEKILCAIGSTRFKSNAYMDFWPSKMAVVFDEQS